jgi:hypothetical protein
LGILAIQASELGRGVGAAKDESVEWDEYV